MPVVVSPAPGSFTAGVADSIRPWGDTGTDWQAYAAAVSAMFEPVWSIVSDQGSPDQSSYRAGWSTLLDLETCPTQFLRYLAQFNGTVVPPGTDDADARAIIRAESGQQRGTRATMEAAAKRNLIKTKYLLFRERTALNGTTDAYHIVIVFRFDEVPSVPALIAAVEAVKPAGIQISYVEWNGYTWNEAVHIWSADTMTWDAAQLTQP